MSPYDLLVSAAARAPGGIATVLKESRWSYCSLLERVDAAARALIAHDVQGGDRVATLDTPHPDYLITWLAANSIGAIWLGLNPKYRANELADIVLDASPKVLFTRSCIGERYFEDELRQVRSACTALQHIIILGEDPIISGSTPYTDFITAGSTIDTAHLNRIRKARRPHDPCLLVYTSGSTGRPKGALLGNAGTVAFALAQNAFWPVAPQRVLNYFPISHIGCALDVSLPCLADAGTLVFMEHFDPVGALRLLQDERITLVGSVPSVYQMQMALPEFAHMDWSAVQLIVWEGAALPAELIDRLLAIGVPLATNYGMTESGSAITAVAPTRERANLINNVGKAFSGVDIRLITDDGREAGTDEVGEVYAKSPYNFLGYWQRPQETSQAFDSDGFLRTGDLAVRRLSGMYEIVGRVKEMYKSGGYNVYPAEVEAVLYSHPSVRSAAVVAIPDTAWQEVGVAFVTLALPIPVADLVHWCATRLANYKVPKRVIVGCDLPLLPIGKIDKIALRRRAIEILNESAPT